MKEFEIVLWTIGIAAFIVLNLTTIHAVLMWYMCRKHRFPFDVSWFSKWDKFFMTSITLLTVFMYLVMMSWLFIFLVFL